MLCQSPHFYHDTLLAHSFQFGACVFVENFPNRIGRETSDFGTL